MILINNPCTDNVTQWLAGMFRMHSQWVSGDGLKKPQGGEKTLILCLLEQGKLGWKETLGPIKTQGTLLSTNIISFSVQITAIALRFLITKYLQYWLKTFNCKV